MAALLRQAHPGLAVDLVLVTTTGDRRLDVPVWELGGQGVFVKEVQAAVLEGRADLAVHSAKDLPSAPTEGLIVCGVPRRGDARDALVGHRLEDLPAGALVATGSVRRRAQLGWLRPDLTFTGVRGNIGTRLRQVPGGGALVVAAAALDRLQLSGQAQRLAPWQLLPQVGQGAIAIETRVGDERTQAAVAAIDDADAHVAVRCERAYLARLGSGCTLPVGAYATVEDGTVRLEAMMATVDGRVLFRGRRAGPAGEAVSVGTALATDLLVGAGGADLLVEAGGTDLVAGAEGSGPADPAGVARGTS